MRAELGELAPSRAAVHPTKIGALRIALALAYLCQVIRPLSVSIPPNLVIHPRRSVPPIGRAAPRRVHKIVIGIGLCNAVLGAARRAEAQLPGTGSDTGAGIPAGRRDSLARAAGVDTARDSLAVRLQRAEEAIALLRQQLNAQAATVTQTSSRARFDITGRVLLNGFSNSRRVNNVDVPQFVRPDTVAGVQNGALGGALRQTTLGGVVFVPRVLGGAFTGDVNVDFYGGQQSSPGGRNFPNLRLRTARGILRWHDAELLVGQDGPMVAAIEPVSVAAVGVAEFGTAGNLWIWLPQVRLTLEKALTHNGPQPGNAAPALGRDPDAGALKIGVQASVLAPSNGDNVGAFDTNADAAEKSRRPFVEGRVRARWGEEERGGEVGVGYHRGWIADPTGPPRSPLIVSEATVINALVPLGGAGPVRFDVRGEAFQGQALRGLGGGGIAQTFAVIGTSTTTSQIPSAALRTRGGWAQANVRYLELLTLGAGCGVDAPRNAPATSATFRLRNNVCEGHAIVRPDGPLLVGLTYRRTRTDYLAGPLVNDHVNLAFGYQF